MSDFVNGARPPNEASQHSKKWSAYLEEFYNAESTAEASIPLRKLVNEVFNALPSALQRDFRALKLEARKVDPTWELTPLDAETRQFLTTEVVHCLYNRLCETWEDESLEPIRHPAAYVLATARHVLLKHYKDSAEFRKLIAGSSSKDVIRRMRDAIFARTSHTEQRLYIDSLLSSIFQAMRTRPVAVKRLFFIWRHFKGCNVDGPIALIGQRRGIWTWEEIAQQLELSTLEVQRLCSAKLSKQQMAQLTNWPESSLYSRQTEEYRRLRNLLRDAIGDV
jgi:hypothetical protein